MDVRARDRRGEVAEVAYQHADAKGAPCRHRHGCGRRLPERNAQREGDLVAARRETPGELPLEGLVDALLGVAGWRDHVRDGEDLGRDHGDEGSECLPPRWLLHPG